MCTDAAGSVHWAIDHHHWSSGAWLAIFRVGVAIWVLAMVQVDGLGVVVTVVSAVVDNAGIVGVDGGAMHSRYGRHCGQCYGGCTVLGC